MNTGRNTNMCHRAKGKGKRSRIPIEVNIQQDYTRVPDSGYTKYEYPNDDSYNQNDPNKLVLPEEAFTCYDYPNGDSFIEDGDTSHVESNLYAKLDIESQNEVMKIECCDGVTIEAEPFKRECKEAMQCLCQWGTTKFNVKSEPLKMIKFYCEGRGEIMDDYADADESVVQHELDKFNSIFLKEYGSHAIEIVHIAFKLMMKGLIKLMMKQVDYLFSKMEEDEVYNFFFVNMRDYSDSFDRMNRELTFRYDWALPYDKVTPKWDIQLLKQKFHDLRSYEQRQLWLTAHFCLRGSVAFSRDARIKGIV